MNNPEAGSSPHIEDFAAKSKIERYQNGKFTDEYDIVIYETVYEVFLNKKSYTNILFLSLNSLL